jgi:hypothetical protein
MSSLKDFLLIPRLDPDFPFEDLNGRYGGRNGCENYLVIAGLAPQKQQRRDQKKGRQKPEKSFHFPASTLIVNRVPRTDSSIVGVRKRMLFSCGCGRISAASRP